MKKIKERKKKFIRRCKNGTVFYIDTYGDRWSNCEPFKVLFVKHNQYLMDRNGCFLKISSMNEKGYEFSAYLFEDLKKSGYTDRFKLEQEIISTYNELLR